jgi:hypothetical protein
LCQAGPQSSFPDQVSTNHGANIVHKCYIFASPIGAQGWDHKVPWSRPLGTEIVISSFAESWRLPHQLRRSIGVRLLALPVPIKVHSVPNARTVDHDSESVMTYAIRWAGSTVSRGLFSQPLFYVAGDRTIPSDVMGWAASSAFVESAT